MNRPTVIIHNAETGEIIEREMNADELAQWEIDQADAAAKQQAEADSAAAKAALLERLGITEEEAKLLIN
jgi:predicted metal-dependent HD superfamily phosphohydrolase